MKKALIIEDDSDIRETVEEMLREEGYDVSSCADGKEGIDLALQKRPAVVICDIVLVDPEYDGYTVLGAIRADPLLCGTPFLFLTAKASDEDRRYGMNLGADDYIPKPYGRADLLQAVDARIRRAESAAATQRVLESTPVIGNHGIAPVFRDPAMIEVMDKLAKVAPSEMTVLLLGEPGVGKEVVAKFTHAKSRRSAKPLVTVNAAALTSTLVESELFGHVKNAFTGATADRKGLFEAADGGTLFIDEVGEATPEVQSKMLRALESKEVTRVGSTTPTRVDVRIIAATNRDLEDGMRTGKIREDFYSRLEQFSITIPPLRERPKDILPLAHTFLSAACRVANKPMVELSAAAAEVLTSYDWPRNVRQLKSQMERAFVLCDGGPIEPEHFELRSTRPSRPSFTPDGNGATLSILDEKQQLEKRRMLEALESCRWNQTRAAVQIGMPRRTFVTRMQQYAIKGPRGK